MVIYQNLAYCRYLQLWTIFYLFNIVKYNPCISLFTVSLLHLCSLDSTSKRILILFQDYILISLIIIKLKCNQNSIIKNLNIFSNLLVFLCYLFILKEINVNPIKLYMEYLPNDDKNYKHENYIEYFKRIWISFFNIYNY